MSIVDAIYHRMRDDTEAVAEAKGDSELVKFYAGLSVLFTGATDLLGKCTLEKLLRDCSQLERVYVLMRVKRGQDFQDKCKKFYDDSVFDTLRGQNGNFKDKLVLMKADLSQENLGLSDDDRKTLTSQVQMIFHNGSANRLDEQISVALKTNVLGTKRMLELARECTRLKVFVFVSTAFSHCHERVIEEKFYRSPAELKTVEDMIVADEAPSGLTKDALKMLLGEWPNVFTFTKATAEELVQQHAPRAPYACCVFRPSVVISTYKEPMPGWCDKKNGVAGLFAKIAKGAVHVMCKTDYPCDLIPADMSANAMLVCAWDAVDRWQIEPEAFVYNYGTSHERPITMRQIKEKIMDDPNGLKTSLSRCRKAYVVFVSNFILYFALRVIMDYVPALIVDILTVAHGYAPESWSLVRESMGDMCRLRRFSSGNWRVRMSEMLKACERLNPRDREIFFSDVRQLDWDDFFLTFWRGIRVHHLGEQLDSLQQSDSDGKGCPCKCKWPCKCRCACLALTFAFGFAVYYAMNAMFF